MFSILQHLQFPKKHKNVNNKQKGCRLSKLQRTIVLLHSRKNLSCYIIYFVSASF